MTNDGQAAARLASTRHKCGAAVLRAPADCARATAAEVASVQQAVGVPGVFVPVDERAVGVRAAVVAAGIVAQSSSLSLQRVSGLRQLVSLPFHWNARG